MGGVDQISVKGWMKPIEVYDMADPDNQEQFVRTFSGQVDGEPDFWYAVNGFAAQLAAAASCSRRAASLLCHVWSFSLFVGCRAPRLAVELRTASCTGALHARVAA